VDILALCPILQFSGLKLADVGLNLADANANGFKLSGNTNR